MLTILRFLQAKILGLFSMAKRQNSSRHPYAISHSALFFVQHCFFLHTSHNFSPALPHLPLKRKGIYPFIHRVSKINSELFCVFLILNLHLYKNFDPGTRKRAEWEREQGCLEEFWRLAIENNKSIFTQEKLIYC